MNDPLTKWFLGLASTAVIALAGWVFTLNADFKAFTAAHEVQQKADAAALSKSLTRIDEKLSSISNNTIKDNEQDRQLRLQWKLISWNRDCLIEVDKKVPEIVYPPKPNLD